MPDTPWNMARRGVVHRQDLLVLHVECFGGLKNPIIVKEVGSFVATLNLESGS